MLHENFSRLLRMRDHSNYHTSQNITAHHQLSATFRLGYESALSSSVSSTTTLASMMRWTRVLGQIMYLNLVGNNSKIFQHHDYRWYHATRQLLILAVPVLLTRTLTRHPWDNPASLGYSSRSMVFPSLVSSFSPTNMIR